MPSDRVFLMLHGFGGAASWWDGATASLREYGRVLAVDLPGHGKEAWQKDTLEGITEKVFARLCLSKDEKVIGIASSFGGLVLLKMWQKHSGIFSRLGFVGSVPCFTADDAYPAGLSIEKINKLSLQLKGDRQAVMGMFFRSLFTAKERLLPIYPSIKELIKATPVPSVDILDAYLEMLAHEDMRDVLRRVDIPVRCIFGDADPICPLELVPVLKRLNPSVGVDMMKNAGHFPFLSHKNEFGFLLKEFVLS